MTVTQALTILVCGLALGCGSTLLGIKLGVKIHRDKTDDEVAHQKARYLADRDEIRRITLGITQSWADGAGKHIKLIAPSALRRASLEQLQVIARDRGILTMSHLGDRDSLISVIESHQKAFTTAHARAETAVHGKDWTIADASQDYEIRTDDGRRFPAKDDEDKRGRDGRDYE